MRQVRESIRSLRILDGERFDPGFLRRKLQKQQAGSKPHATTAGAGHDRGGTSSANASGSDGETVPSPKKPTKLASAGHTTAPEAVNVPVASRTKKSALASSSSATEDTAARSKKPAAASHGGSSDRDAVPSSDLPPRPKKGASASNKPSSSASATRGKRGRDAVEAPPAPQEDKSGVVAVIAAPAAKKRKHAPAGGDVWSRLTAPDADLGAEAATSAWT